MSNEPDTHERWKELCKEVRKSARHDKREYVVKKCEELEKHEGNAKFVFATVKEVTRKFSAKLNVVNDENGNPLSNKEEISSRWYRYCNTLYGGDDWNDGNYYSSETEIEPEPLRSEVVAAMKELKTSKAAGVDGIPAELIKCLGEEGVSMMWQMCKKIWKTGKWSTDWRRAVFVTLPKKGNLKECSNHRTISLISHASKVLLKIINGRMKNKIKEEVSVMQAGFRAGRGTRDHILNLKNIMEKYRDHKLPLYLCFIDYSKAFDCVEHRALWSVMEELGFPKHIIKLISNLYEDQESAVRLGDNSITDWFKIGKGVRQGCILSPNLFSIYTERIMRKALDGFDGGIVVGGRNYTDLRYADDTVLMASDRTEMERLFEAVRDASAELGLRLNVKKTKMMVIGGSTDPFYSNGEEIEQVEEFVYLGSRVVRSSKSLPEVKRRLAIARDTVSKLTPIWRCPQIPKRLKLRLLQATAFAIASYGSEAWALTRKDEERVRAFEMWCYRRLLRVKWMDKKRNREVLDELGVTAPVLMSQIRRRRLQYYGHIARGGSLENDIAEGMVPGKRSRGRPAVKWSDDLRMTVADGSFANAKRLTGDRVEWRNIMTTATRPG